MDILNLAEEFAKNEYAKHDEIHQWNHIEKVMDIAEKLARHHPECDMEILKLAIIFHDISYERYETHVDESVKLAERFLKEHNYPEERVRKVMSVMISHSGPHRRKLGDTKLIEGKIIYDSDKFYIAQTPEGFGKYYPSFYLDETRVLFKKTRPDLFK